MSARLPRLCFAGLVLGAFLSSRAAELPAAPAGWQLAWHDEFDRDGAPDAAKWNYDAGTGHNGWGNHELQFYTKDRRENARVEQGHLIIEARREPWQGSAYTS